MRKIEFRMEDSEIALLDQYAKMKGVSRAVYIREQLFKGRSKEGFSPKDLSALVSSAYRQCDLPRAQVERLVHHVFAEIMSGPREATNPGL